MILSWVNCFDSSKMNLDLTLLDAENLYLELRSKGLNLDMTRGKPHSDQLDLSDELENSLSGNYLYEGIDTRNYGELLGLEACRQLGADLIDCKREMVIAGGNSSLTLMSQFLSSLYFHGAGKGPFFSRERTSFLCPVPGYDRHFKLCEEFSINMIPVPLTGSGPDIEQIKSLIDNDSSIKGIWCVPKHSNPTGETYSEENVHGLLEIVKEAEKDFRILWDNAYSVHDFRESVELPNIFEMAKELEIEDSVIGFSSTSKISNRPNSFVRIFLSIAFDGYSCSIVMENLSKKASFKMFVPINRPSSEPLPFVLAVAIIVNPDAGVTYSPVFLLSKPFPSRTGCKQRILFDAKSISSIRRTAPFLIALRTGPSLKTILPSTKVFEPIKSSSSVSTVILTL